MTGDEVCAAVLLGALALSAFVAGRGDPIDRVVGLELVTAVAVTFMIVLAQVTRQSYYLSVPLVLAPLSFAGTLVFTRLLGRRDD